MSTMQLLVMACWTLMAMLALIPTEQCGECPHCKHKA